MISKIRFRKFKQFKDCEIELGGTGLLLLAGGNNTGKTSLFHGLAVWEFCRTLVEAEKGKSALTPGQKFQGVGIGEHEFLPINLPSLSHLWTNLKPQKVSSVDDDGYTLRIRCNWMAGSIEKFLEFGLALANDRLFVRTTASNLTVHDPVPRVAYLPPFAGIASREQRLPLALRRRKVGEGLAGSVLRNGLLDLFLLNEQKRKELRDGKSKISDADLKALRQEDPWELVQQALREVFGAELSISPFNETYHSYINVEVVKGAVVGHKLTRHPGFKNRDIMVEGSGLLQWLSVFSLATSPEYDVLLLDEPDAHLHTTLQRSLSEKLRHLGGSKLVLVATHSPEVLRWSPPGEILGFKKGGKPPRILKSETEKVGLIAGIGSVYLPKLDSAKLTKKILFVEGESDARVLAKAATLLGRKLPESWVVWPEKSPHSERVRLARALGSELEGLKVVSIRDRDLLSANAVGKDLVDKGIETNGTITSITWKRRNIESYLIWPAAISKATNRSVGEIELVLQDEFGIAVGKNFLVHSAPAALLDVDGKKVLAHFKLGVDDLIETLDKSWVPDDFVTVLDTLDLVGA